jgi:carbamoylphosphate synthase small subunit
VVCGFVSRERGTLSLLSRSTFFEETSVKTPEKKRKKKREREKNKNKKIMSVAGIDFGSKSNVVALARRKGIDVVMNEESKRETPSLINFGDKCVSLSFFLR